MDGTNRNKNLIKICFIGDITCDRPMLNAAKKDEKYDFKRSFRPLKSLFKDADYVIGNLETVCAGKNFDYNPGYINLNSPDELIRDLALSGIDMVSTANNHCADCGVEGIVRTIRLLEKYGVEHTGTFLKNSDKRFTIKKIGSIKIAFFSYTYPLNIDLPHRQNNFYINLLSSGEYAGIPIWKKFIKIILPKSLIHFLQERIAFFRRNRGEAVIKPYIDSFDMRNEDKNRIQGLIKMLKHAKEESDIIFLCLHQGGQFNADPGKHTLELCKVLSPYVDVIIGNHPHVVQRIDIVKKKIIAYSLGSLNLSISADYLIKDDLPDYSIVLNLYIRKKRTKTTIEKVAFSIVKAVEDENHYVEVYPVEDLYGNMSFDEKKKLRKDILIIYNRFTGLHESSIDICKEYSFIYEVRLDETKIDK